MSDFIPQFQPWFDEREAQAALHYLQSGGWLTEFKHTQEFARLISEFTGARYCSILSNGTVSLTAALLAAGIGTGDEVIVPAYTMIATANAVSLAFGAKPVFADVERETMGLDFESMKAAVTRKTRAIMLVSINGRYPHRLQEILTFCQERELMVIEDAAQSLGSFHKGRHVGRYGQMGSFSFSMPKIITTGQGGALITDNPQWHEKIELVRNFGRKSAGVDEHVFFGVNFKFTDLQAVIGIEQMKKLSERIPLKKRNYRLLREAMRSLPKISFFETAEDVAPWFNDVLAEDRDALQAHLKSKGIGTRPFYPSLPSQVPYQMKTEQFPNAKHLAAHGLWLPSSAQLGEPEINRIAEAIQSFYT